MKKKNKNRRILYGYHNLRELSERALRNLDGAMDETRLLTSGATVWQERYTNTCRILQRKKKKQTRTRYETGVIG